MNPQLIALLTQMFGGNSSILSNLTGKFQEFNQMNQGGQNNIDPALDITPFKVNPTRGMKEGGLTAAGFMQALPSLSFLFPSMSLLPAGFQELQQGGKVKGGDPLIERSQMVDRTKTDLINYILSPEYLQRLSLSTDKPDEVRAQRLLNLITTDISNEAPKNPNADASYNSTEHALKFGKTPVYKDTVLHELTHALNKSNQYLPKEKEIISDALAPYDPKTMDKEVYEYLSDPTEVHARLNVLRDYAKKKGLVKGNKNITENDILKIIEVYEDDEFEHRMQEMSEDAYRLAPDVYPEYKDIKVDPAKKSELNQIRNLMQLSKDENKSKVLTKLWNSLAQGSDKKQISMAEKGGELTAEGFMQLPLLSFLFPSNPLLPTGFQELQKGGVVGKSSLSFNVTDSNNNSKQGSFKEIDSESKDLILKLFMQSAGIDDPSLISDDTNVVKGINDAIYDFSQKYGEVKIRRGKKGERAHYNPLSKTMYINSFDEIAKELTHVQQHKERGLIDMGANTVQSWLKSAFITPEKPRLPAYNNTYHMPGALEYEAHTLMEPKIEMDLMNMIVNKLSELPQKQKGGAVNTTGYTPGTESFTNPFNIIPSNSITMAQTPFPLMGIASNGLSQLMLPGNNYKFPGADSVMEIPIAKKGGFFDRLWKGLKGGVDTLTTTLGMPNLIKNSGYDEQLANSSFLRGIQGVASAGLGAANPLVGALQMAGGMFGGGGGQGGQGGGGSFMGGFGGNFNPVTMPQGSLFDMINQPGIAPNTGQGGGGFDMSSILGMLGGMGGGQGTAPINGGIPGLSDIFSATSGNTGIGGGVDPNLISQLFGGGNNPMQSIQTLLQQLQGRKKGGFIYQMGGPVQMIPIQTEKVNGQPEMIIHLDKTITPVNAKKKHSQMDEDEITDLVPAGSYIASADKNMKMKKSYAEERVVGLKTQSYKERQQGKVPEEITLADRLWSNNKDQTPAALAEKLAKIYSTVDKKDWFEHSDVFTQKTNEENINSRTPYLGEIIMYNEMKRSGAVMASGEYQKGGVVKMQGGGFLEALPGLASVFGPLLGNIFGKNQPTNPGQISPFVQMGMLSTIPQYQLGVTQNIGAQSNALNQGISDFSALGNQLIQNARQSTATQNAANFGNTFLGMTNALGRETNLDRLNLDASRARVNNYRPTSATQASVDAATTPQFDATSIMQQLGPRSGQVLSQLYSQQLGNRNQVMQNRNQTLDNANLFRINELNRIDQTEQPFNIQQKEKELALRQAQNDDIFGTAQAGLQRGADLQSGLLGQTGAIQSQILPITTQFALQNAGLAGQGNILGAQNAFNAYSTLGGMQSQNALAAAMNPQAQATAAPGQQGANPMLELFNQLLKTNGYKTDLMGIGNLLRDALSR